MTELLDMPETSQGEQFIDDVTRSDVGIDVQPSTNHDWNLSVVDVR